ncbi:hypothetical protein BVC80_243g47 [Macleaya cordata]|uniref:Uncharacterized protein n=1 Tax=Macleaya cordata TaxID=56857 RepID=A0A200R125_MACCD|nr:hypothetical protein BVC80_243g47 [Macleaya cordata]
MWVFLSVSLLAVSVSSSCSPHLIKQTKPIFEQKTDRFWEFEEQSNSWIEVNLPFDLVSCVDGNCTKVGTLDQMMKKKNKEECSGRESRAPEQGEKLKSKSDNNKPVVQLEDLGPRKRVSLTKMSETSIWITGGSGSIYERFWNGVQWVIAPHDLPATAGRAVSVFIVNQTILALSETGNLYQLQVSENTQPIWTENTPTFELIINGREIEASSTMQIKSGVLSYDGQRVYFSTMNGSLLELSEAEPQRWIYHGRPPGGDVAAIADAASIKPDVVFTVSSTGDLYEFDRSSKPSWKKHIWTEGTTPQETSLTPLTGCASQGLVGVHSLSLFLLTKAGYLVERRLHQRKWKWIVHGGPKDHRLTSITPVVQDELNENIFSLFFTTATGFIFEYQLPKHSGVVQGNQMQQTWVNHMHPMHAKAARGIPGLQFQIGRILFPLDDGRLAELHLSGIRSEASGPTHPVTVRRKASIKYEWSVLDAPETEGWNTEYCTEERGPSNCITGIRDEPNESDTKRPISRRRKGGQENPSYLVPSTSEINLGSSLDQNNFLANGINTNFRLRVMQAGRSFFFITDNGLTFEYLYAENLWLWLRHEHSTIMKGVLGNYNGSLFMVDMHGNLLIRERNGNDLSWINCTAMRKGRQVIGGPPWDGIPGKAQRVTMEDALFFVSKNGSLVQFTVFSRKFKWKDCRHPPSTRIACIVDQENFRENIVFVIGRNGRLYQYNKVTELWHEHHQSPHLILSRLPGTAMRFSSSSLMGSLFMVAEDGGLVEYHWDTLDGWNWVEHGTPYKTVTLVGAPGPCFQSTQLFLIGSDGKVYLRYLDKRIWKWKCYGFPSMENIVVMDQQRMEAEDSYNDICVSEGVAHSSEKKAQSLNDHDRNCDAKVASIRPIPFSDDSMIFELRDGRLAELRRIDDIEWIWSHTIATPTSLCLENYWTASMS